MLAKNHRILDATDSAAYPYHYPFPLVLFNTGREVKSEGFRKKASPLLATHKELFIN